MGKPRTERHLLTPDEIRVLSTYAIKYQAAQERLRLLTELEDEFMQQLRTKYALDESWTCQDLLLGFVKEGVPDDQND